jgi:hypothetical protein
MFIDDSRGISSKAMIVVTDKKKTIDDVYIYTHLEMTRKFFRKKRRKKWDQRASEREKSCFVPSPRCMNTCQDRCDFGVSLVSEPSLPCGQCLAALSIATFPHIEEKIRSILFFPRFSLTFWPHFYHKHNQKSKRV